MYIVIINEQLIEVKLQPGRVKNFNTSRLKPLVHDRFSRTPTREKASKNRPKNSNVAPVREGLRDRGSLKKSDTFNPKISAEKRLISSIYDTFSSYFY